MGWRTIGEIIGLVAVVVSVLLLAWELNSANRLAASTAQAEINQLYNDWNLVIVENPEVASFMARLAGDKDLERAGIEHERALGLAAWLRNTWSTQLRSYEEGVLPERHLKAMKADVHWVATTYPGLRFYLRQVVEDYDQGDPSEVDRTILEALAN